MDRVTFSPDENTVLLDGAKFTAQTGGEPGRCTGCQMKQGFGCRLAEAVPGVPFGAPKCQPEYRKDGQGVVWVLPSKRR